MIENDEESGSAIGNASKAIKIVGLSASDRDALDITLAAKKYIKGHYALTNCKGFGPYKLSIILKHESIIMKLDP